MDNSIPQAARPSSFGGPVSAAPSPFPNAGGKSIGGPAPVPFHVQRAAVTEAWQSLQDRMQEYRDAYNRAMEFAIGHPEYRPAMASLYERFVGLSQAHENFLMHATFHL